jgi:hypothetical protein
LPDKVLSASVILALVAVAAIAFASVPTAQKGEGTQQAANHVVPPNQIVSGGPPPDGIPSIDNPRFVSAANASVWLANDYDSVIGVSLNGDVRAYPLQILVWHEIVNDVVGGVPIAVTYCPLCYSSSVFIRQINGTTVQFGTSGKLYNNNLVMYDRLTKSLWSQIWGQAIAGSLTGQTLQRVPIDVTTWGQWKKLHPNTSVLSRQTGFNRDYGDDPYGAYYFTNDIYFPLTHHDQRLPPKTVIVGLTVGGVSKAYVLNSPFGQGSVAYSLENVTSPLLLDTVGGKILLVWQYGQVVRFFNPVINGKLLTFTSANGTIVDSGTGSTWNFDGHAVSGPLKGESMARYVSETEFWFAWAAFHPDTPIYLSP